jgi:hypothetical protein
MVIGPCVALSVPVSLVLLGDWGETPEISFIVDESRINIVYRGSTQDKR